MFTCGTLGTYGRYLPILMSRTYKVDLLLVNYLSGLRVLPTTSRASGVTG